MFRIPRFISITRRLTLLLVLAAALFPTLGLLWLEPAWAARQSAQAPPSTSVPVTTTSPALENQVRDLERRASSLETWVVIILTPMGVLVGILALGGAFGVVFSVRDQRRVSQLHELSVASETASQRRSEESYATFLEASQKTLTLVNDTLALAKEASERAAQTMQLKAQRNLASIDEQAQFILDRVYLSGDFKKLVVEAPLRTQLEAVAGELAAIEGYLVLQDISLSPACLFVKGMARHLRHDAHGALNTLRQAGHQATVRDLRALAEYWLAYIHNNLGQYRDAAEVFQRARTGVLDDSMPAFELDRIILESEFFERADMIDHDTDRARSWHTGARLEVMESITADLGELARKAGQNPRYARISRRIAQTHANVLTWAAAVKRSPESRVADPEYQTSLERARELYESAGKSLFARFGALESAYYLSHDVNLKEYALVESMAMDEQRTRTEPRNTANLQETIMIVRHRQTEHTDVRGEAIREAYAKVQAALGAVDEETTVFSQFEKRNLARDDFANEVLQFYDQARQELPVASRKRRQFQASRATSKPGGLEGNAEATHG